VTASALDDGREQVIANGSCILVLVVSIAAWSLEAFPASRGWTRRPYIRSESFKVLVCFANEVRGVGVRSAWKLLRTVSIISRVKSWKWPPLGYSLGAGAGPTLAFCVFAGFSTRPSYAVCAGSVSWGQPMPGVKVCAVWLKLRCD